MKHIASSIIGFAASTAFLFTGFFNTQLNLVDRWHAGTIEEDVVRVQTIIVNGKPFVVQKAVNVNMQEIGRFVVCHEKSGVCK